MADLDDKLRSIFDALSRNKPDPKPARRAGMWRTHATKTSTAKRKAISRRRERNRRRVVAEQRRRRRIAK